MFSVMNMFVETKPEKHEPVSQQKDYDGDEWYTPPEILDAARRVMGGIDLDPAACDEAQKVVKAATYYTKADDGLTHPRKGRVWLNPPYSKPVSFIDTVLRAYNVVSRT